MTATLIRTRRPLLGRLIARVMVAYLGILKRSAKNDLAYDRHLCAHLPLQVERGKAHLAGIEKRLQRASTAL